MGLGDATLLLVAGAWFGWKGMLFALLAGSVQGTVIILLTFLAKGQVAEPEVVARERAKLLALLEATDDPEEREELEQELAADPVFEEGGEGVGAIRIPFGPFLALAMMEYLLVGGALVERYMQWLLLPW
jgi:leader peptidase (prepilin peptidase)/N-methyltransferase